ncbi:MAG TPA: DegT/DnrJ/EryC1/StrS family aminotransferase [Acidobacteriota bacterium]|jgi:dTDP-4-amino-4,6-dideoxygalactose transaminase
MPKLAIAGGNPVRQEPVARWPQFDEREQKGLAGVLQSGNWGGYPFPNDLADRFAQRFAAYHDARFGLCAANGTVALEIALKSAAIKPGDEVIVPAYTFEATAVPVLRLGAVPVFVDISPQNYCVSPSAIEDALTERSRAVIPVHMAMNMADMDAIMAIAARHQLRVIEDCAHAHGAAWKNRGAGSYGDAGSFSMQTSKLMTAGEGGVVITSDERVFELCQSYTNCGRASTGDRFGDRILGFNYRMTEFQAAVLLAQLERLPAQTEKRSARADQLRRTLAEVQGVTLLQRDERLTRQAIYHFVFKYDNRFFGGVHRDRFVAALECEGVPCDGLFYEPLYRSALFHVDPRDFPQLKASSPETLPWANTRCPAAEHAAYEESVWLPHPLFLGNEQVIDQIAEAILKIQQNIDELRNAEHPLIEKKSCSRVNRRD